MSAHFRVLAMAALLAAGCGGGRFRRPVLLGGQTVEAATLNAGHEAYMLYCYACHGAKGNGQGPSSPGLRPPPRDFSAGIFKFGGVATGQLPNDEALLRTVRRGLAGTPMLPWDITDAERTDIIQYIKTFSPRWRTEKPGDPIVPTPDPWAGKEAEAVERGKRVYHLSGAEKDAAGHIKGVLAGCNGCHPSYLTRQETAHLSQELLGVTPTDFPAGMYASALKDSEFMAGDHKMQFLPIDFLFHKVKSGTTPEDLYRTIASGIGGTAMPTWKGVLGEADLWALVHYVKSLIDLRDTSKGRELRLTLINQPAWTPPPVPAPEAAPAGTPAPAMKG